MEKIEVPWGVTSPAVRHLIMDMAMDASDPKWAAVIALSFILGPASEDGDPPEGADPDTYRDYTLDFIARCDYVWQLSVEKRS